MSYTYSFADNAEYGAEDLNALVKSLVVSGVGDVFENDKPYNTEIINDIIQNVYTDGVVPENVTTLKVSKVSDGTIAIAPGLAFFANGSTIRITGTEKLSYEKGVTNYVYLKQDLAEQNRNYPVCSTTSPTANEDTVMLAEILADGTVEDKRKYAKGKVPGYQSNANCAMVINQAFTIDPNTQGTSGTGSLVCDMGANNYSRAFVIVKKTNYTQLGMYSFGDNSYLSLYFAGEFKGWSTEEIVIGSDSESGREPLAYLTFSAVGSKLTVTHRWSINKSRGKQTYKYTLILC